MEKQKKLYLNIQILRVIISFNIIVFHCIANKKQNIFIYFISRIAVYYYVPTFFFISFYFSHKTFISRNIFKLKERLLRISIPYIIWPCIFWIKYNIDNKINGIEDKDKYKILLYQLLFGKPINPVFWFQFCLLFWTIIFIILIFLFKHLYNYVLISLFAIILVLNYFGFSYLILKNYKGLYSVSITDLFYRNIFMFSGFYFGVQDFYQSNFSIKIKIIAISLISIFIIKLSINKIKFDYISVQFIVNIIFIASSFFPFDFIKNKNIILIIKQITSYTGGVYYLHWQIRHKILKNFILIKNADFMSCINNYILCYFFSFISFKIFKNTKLKYLFI